MSIQPSDAISLQPVDITIAGQPLIELPTDLYIPPDALRILLDTFEGPLDLLLYLIKKQHIDILDIPVAEITKQYMHFVTLMQVINIEWAAEYLVMAATLTEIKSRLLLPRPAATEEEAGLDPRADLVYRLQEYERYKQAAQNLDALPLLERDTYLAQAGCPVITPLPIHSAITMAQLMEALQVVFKRASLSEQYAIVREPLSIRERMTIVLSAIAQGQVVAFNELFTIEEGKRGVVVTLIAILELIRQASIELIQSEPFATIYVRARGE